MCKQTLLLDIEGCVGLCVTHTDPEQEQNMHQTVTSLPLTPFGLKDFWHNLIVALRELLSGIGFNLLQATFTNNKF